MSEWWWYELLTHNGREMLCSVKKKKKNAQLGVWEMLYILLFPLKLPEEELILDAYVLISVTQIGKKGLINDKTNLKSLNLICTCLENSCVEGKKCNFG